VIAEENNNDRVVAIGLSPALVMGYIDAIFVTKITDSFALTIPCNYYDMWLVPKMLELDSSLGAVSKTKKPFSAGAGLGARFITQKKGLSDSFYLEARASFKYEQMGFDIKGSPLGVEGMSIEPMLRLGWDWFWQSGFYMTLGGGIGYALYMKNKREIPKSVEDNIFLLAWLPKGQDGIRWDLEWKLGVAF
jgi:hypothetical protein